MDSKNGAIKSGDTAAKNIRITNGMISRAHMVIDVDAKRLVISFFTASLELMLFAMVSITIASLPPTSACLA